MSADWVERASHLIEQSKKTAASVVLGVGIAAVVAFYARETWPAYAQLAASLQMFLAVVLLIASYSVAVLIVGTTVDIFRGVRNLIIRNRAEKVSRRSAWLERAEKQRQLEAILPELTTRHWDFLSQFKAKNAGDRPSAIIGPRAEDEILPDLKRHGFIVEVAKIEKARTLFELTPAAAPIVPPFIADYRRRMITSALERAGEPEKTILRLFGDPEPAPGHPRHPWIEGKCYNTIFPLTQSKVLAQGRAKFQDVAPGPPHTETIILTPDAIPLVEEMLGFKVVRESVVLDLSQVGSTVGSGSGLRSNPYL